MVNGSWLINFNGQFVIVILFKFTIVIQVVDFKVVCLNAKSGFKLLLCVCWVYYEIICLAIILIFFVIVLRDFSCLTHSFLFFCMSLFKLVWLSHLKSKLYVSY